MTEYNGDPSFNCNLWSYVYVTQVVPYIGHGDQCAQNRIYCRLKQIY